MDSNTGDMRAHDTSMERLAPPRFDELLQLVTEQSKRLELLEASMVPLPEATSRTKLGRRAVVRRRVRQTPESQGPLMAAAEAFAELAPVTARYAALHIADGFNWAEVTSRVVPGEWYMVVFRSVRREAIDDLTLEMHDYGAYIEAQRRAIGLLFYFRGTANEDRECMSFCIWNSRQEAVRAAQLPLHRVAMSMVDEKYEWYELERYTLSKKPGAAYAEIIPMERESEAARPVA